MLVALTLLSTVLLLTYIYFTTQFNYWKLRGVPFIKPKFLFGSILEIAFGKVHPGKYIGTFYYQFDGPYFGFYAFNRPYLVAKDPEFIKTILIRDFKYFSNRYFICDDKIDQANSNGLFAIKDEKWRWLRSKMNPFFSLAKLKLMISLNNESSKNLSDYVKKNLGKSVEVKEMCAKYTTDAMVSCFFGITVNSFQNSNGFRLAGKKMLSQSLLRCLKVFSYYYAPELVKMFKFEFLDPLAVDFLRKTFEDVISQREKSKAARNDFIDVLIQLKNEQARYNEEFKLEGDNLTAQAITFFSSGYESSASTFAFTLHELGVHPNIQARLREEINDKIEKYGLTYAAIAEMKYLQMVVSESLRKYPTTSFIHRECIEHYKVEKTNLTIEKGTPIVIAQYGLHYNSAYFPNPERYDPERFSKRNVHTIKPCTYLPFSDGPRNCIGQMFGLMMVKMGIIEVVRHFEIHKNAHTVEPVVLAPFPIIQACGGLHLTFENINK